MFKMSIAGLCLASLAVLATSRLHAQYAPAPTTYSIEETSALFGPAVKLIVYRDGSRALVESSHEALPGGKAVHLRTLYDLVSHRSITWDLLDTATPCGSGNFSGDWGDPFALSAEMNADISKQNAKPAGEATVNGIATKVFEAGDAGAAEKVWLEAKYGLIVKLVMTAKAATAQTLLEVSDFSLQKPAPSVFALPPQCAKAAAAPPVPTEAEKIAAFTGDSAANYADAILPPASQNSCNVAMRVVRAGSMQPVTGFQIGVDTNVDLDHPAHYTIGAATVGGPLFSGGGLHDVTGQLRNGVLHLQNAPPQFGMELIFPSNAGFASGLIYRQCFAPQTTLLLVIKNPDKISDGAEWLWVKSGKYGSAGN